MLTARIDPAYSGITANAPAFHIPACSERAKRRSYRALTPFDYDFSIDDKTWEKKLDEGRSAILSALEGFDTKGCAELMKTFGEEVAVGILVDASEAVHAEELAGMKAAALSLVETGRAAGIPVTMTVFPSIDPRDVCMDLYSPKTPEWAFDQSLESLEPRGTGDLPSAMAAAGSVLATADRPFKLLMILSAWEGSSKVLERMTGRLLEKGIRTAMISVGSRAASAGAVTHVWTEETSLVDVFSEFMTMTRAIVGLMPEPIGFRPGSVLTKSALPELKTSANRPALRKVRSPLPERQPLRSVLPAVTAGNFPRAEDERGLYACALQETFESIRYVKRCFNKMRIALGRRGPWAVHILVDSSLTPGFGEYESGDEIARSDLRRMLLAEALLLRESFSGLFMSRSSLSLFPGGCGGTDIARFDTAHERALENLSAVSLAGSPDPVEALFEARLRLADAPEPNRLVLVITEGLAGRGMKREFGRLRAAGIRTAVLCCGVCAPSGADITVSYAERGDAAKALVTLLSAAACGRDITSVFYGRPNGRFVRPTLKNHSA